MLATKKIKNLKPGDPVTMRVEGAKADISFYVDTPGGREVVVAKNEDATVLTTTRAWNFIGAMMGPYARLEE